MLEPRGHADMCGAVLTEPTQPGSDAGVLFMHTDGFSRCVATASSRSRRLRSSAASSSPRRTTRRIVFDTAGRDRARDGRARRRRHVPHRARECSRTCRPSSLHPGVDVPLPGMRLRADVAFGGEFYAIVDAESAGVAGGRNAGIGDLRRIGRPSRRRSTSSVTISASAASREVTTLAGTIFTAAPETPGADLRNATVFAGGAVDRSPCGTGIAAVMAVLDAMGLLICEQPLRIGEHHRTGVSGAPDRSNAGRRGHRGDRSGDCRIGVHHRGPYLHASPTMIRLARDSVQLRGTRCRGA